MKTFRCLSRPYRFTNATNGQSHLICSNAGAVKDLACLDTYYGFAVFNSLEAIWCWTLVSFVIPVVAT